jgi:hypothetical protein
MSNPTQGIDYKAEVLKWYPDAHWVQQSGHIYRAHQMSPRHWQGEDYFDGPLGSNSDEAMAWHDAYCRLQPSRAASEPAPDGITAVCNCAISPTWLCPVHHFEFPGHAASPSPKEPQPDTAFYLEQEVRYLRWISHGHKGIYGDDGEMQCGECAKYGCWDYKNAPLADMRKAYQMAKFESQPPSPEPQVVEFPPLHVNQDFEIPHGKHVYYVEDVDPLLSSARALLREKDASIERLTARVAQRDRQIEAFNSGGFADADAMAEKYLDLESSLAAAKQEIALAGAHAEALEQKYAGCPHQNETTCACSYDHKNDVCMVHSPKVMELTASLSSLGRAVEEARNKLENIFCPHVPGERVSDLSTVREAITMLEAILSRATRLEQKIAAQKEEKR